MTIRVWVLGDQLWAEQSALSSCADEQLQSQVIFIESLHHAQELPYHLQKLVAGYLAAIAFGTPSEMFAGQSKDLFAISRFEKSHLEKVIPEAWGSPVLPQCNS